MKAIFFHRVFLCLMVATTGLHAADSGTEAVLRADAVRLRAMEAADGAELGRVFSDEIVFVHSDGRAEGKSDYIRNMTGGDTAYADVRTSGVEAKAVTDDVVVLVGAQEMRKKLGPNWSEIKLRFMSVWRREGEAWRMIAWQSLRPAGNSVVPPSKAEIPTANAQTPKKSQ
jgi:hypothetical protein